MVKAGSMELNLYLAGVSYFVSKRAPKIIRVEV